MPSPGGVVVVIDYEIKISHKGMMLFHINLLKAWNPWEEPIWYVAEPNWLEEDEGWWRTGEGEEDEEPKSEWQLHQVKQVQYWGSIWRLADQPGNVRRGSSQHPYLSQDSVPNLVVIFALSLGGHGIASDRLKHCWI